MKCTISNKHVLELYTTGKSRKYKVTSSVLRKFFMRIQQLEAARDIHDLWKTPSLHFERLKGHKDRYSIKIDQKWRLEMNITWQNEEQIIGDINIIEISKHYGD